MTFRFQLVVVMGGIAALGPSPSPTPDGRETGAGPATLRATSPMADARAAHTSTTLIDGTILVVGGFTGDEAQLAVTELFDQKNERFERIAGLRMLRQSHTATRLRDGKVLIAGGMGERGQYHDTAELYDAVSRTFTMTGRMTAARSNHEAVLLDDGRVLLVGGVGTGWTFLASAELFDPHTGTFTVTDAMRESREGHAAVKLNDGRVLVTGGHNGRGRATVVSRTAEIYDAGTGRFAPVGAMAIRRHKHDVARLEDGRVLVLGGADETDSNGVYTSVEVFDPVTGDFGVGIPMRLGRYKHRGTTFPLAGGTLLLAGGAPQAEEYDPSGAGGRVIGGADRMPGQFSAASPLPGGRILITGGYGQGRGPQIHAWIFQPSANGRTGR